MAVHDLGYQRWNGSLGTRTLRWLPMVRYHVQLALKRKLVWLILLVAMLPALMFSAVIYFSSDSVREGSRLDDVAAMGMAVGAVENGPVDIVLRQVLGPGQEDRSQMPLSTADKYRLVTSHGLFLFLLWPQTFIVMLVASAIGANLIAQDIRSNALEIYLTKPITPLDYVLGKVSVVALFIMLTTFVPAMIVFSVAAASWQGFLDVTWPVIPRLFAACGLAAIVNSVVILGLSSLAKSGRYATVIWFAMGFITSASATFLTLFTERESWGFISYRNNFLYLIARIMDVDLSRFSSVAQPEASVLPSIVILGLFVVVSGLIMRRTIRAVEAS